MTNLVFFSFFLLFFISSFLFLFSFYILSLDNSFSFVLFPGSYTEFGFTLDYSSSLILLMLGTCGLLSLPFSLYYADSCGSNSVSLYWMVELFITVMFILILCSQPINTLVMWELLGLVSVFLILFNRTSLSCRSAIITVVSSRFGDVLLAVFVCWYCISYHSFCLAGWLLFVGIVGKSAMFPFISWLLQAMRAPTPVSCLVHSSTLVAAGVWMSLRFDFELGPTTCLLLLVLSLVTIVFSGLSAIVVSDLKQLVALSTCNNISWCILCVSVGDIDSCIWMLITHGVLKCLLFMVLGDLFNSSNHSQSGVNVLSLGKAGKAMPISSLLLVSSLAGFPAMGIFMVKHGILDSVCLSNNFPLSIFTLLCVLLTFCYSYRLLFIVLSPSLGLSSCFLRAFVISNFCCLVPSIVNLLFTGASVIPTLVDFTMLDFFALSIFGCQVIGLVAGYLLAFYQDISFPNFRGYLLSLFGCNELVCVLSYINWEVTALLMAVYYFQWEVWLIKTLHNICSLNTSKSIFYMLNVNILSFGLLWFMLYNTIFLR